MLNRGSQLIAARIALALMLFAQGVMAWAACELPERSPALALGSPAGHECCDEEAKAPVSPTCFAHCLAEKQALYKADLDLPPMPVAPILIVMPVSEVLPGAGVAGAAYVLLATGPPRRILLQSFQI